MRACETTNVKRRRAERDAVMEHLVKEEIAESFESWWSAFSRLGVKKQKTIAKAAFKGGWATSALMLRKILKGDE